MVVRLQRIQKHCHQQAGVPQLGDLLVNACIQEAEDVDHTICHGCCILTAVDLPGLLLHARVLPSLHLANVWMYMCPCACLQAQEGRLSQHEAATIMRCVLEFLQDCHARNVCYGERARQHHSGCHAHCTNLHVFC
jgi:hypothetical protein